MASKIEWIKITTGMFEDEKLEFIDTLPEGDAIINIWVRLLCMAGKCNAGGYIFITEKIPYSEDALASKFRKKPIVVKMALATLTELGMIFREDDGAIAIANWSKHQNVEGMEKVREQTRARVATYREKKKAIEGPIDPSLDCNGGNGKCNVTERYEVTHSSSSVSDSSSLSSPNSKSGESKAENAEAARLSALLLELHRRIDPKYLADGPKASEAISRWAGDIDKLIRIDGRSAEEVGRIIRWAKADSFWTSNIISGKKLREKFPTLVAHAARQTGPSKLRPVEMHRGDPSKKTDEQRRKEAAEFEALKQDIAF